MAEVRIQNDEEITVANEADEPYVILGNKPDFSRTRSTAETYREESGAEQTDGPTRKTFIKTLRYPFL